MAFKKATKSGILARVALCGPTGSGKTWTALEIARVLAGDKRVAVIDTERSSSDRYSEIFDFDNDQLTTFGPYDYINKLREVDPTTHGCTVIDSLSHAWMGKGGALERVGDAAARSYSNNKYVAWREVTPEHNLLIDTLMGHPTHLIVTMRSKMDYVLQEDERGRKVPTRVGMAPIQRDGVEYEFDIVGDMTVDNRLNITKTRCPSLSGKSIIRPGRELGLEILAFCGSPVMEDTWTPTATDFDYLLATGKEVNKSPDDLLQLVSKMFGKSPKMLNRNEYNAVLNQIKGEL